MKNLNVLFLLFLDPCRSMDKYYTYASGFNCRSYYQCNSRGRSMAMCCKNNESFNPDLGKCVRDNTCKIDCTARQFYQAGSNPSYSSFRETQREVQRDLKVNVQVTETYECESKLSQILISFNIM